MDTGTVDVLPILIGLFCAAVALIAIGSFYYSRPMKDYRTEEKRFRERATAHAEARAARQQAANETATD